MTGISPAVRTGRLACFFLAALLAAPLLSHAQFGGGVGGMGGMGGMRPGGSGGPGSRSEGRPPSSQSMAVPYREDPGLAVLRGLNETRELLHLQPEQRDAWARYADRVMALAADLLRAPNPARFEGKPVPGQLDALADVARNRLTAVEDVVDAGKALYASLTDEQKALADGRLARIALPLLESDAAGQRRTPGGAPSEGPFTTRREPN